MARLTLTIVNKVDEQGAPCAVEPQHRTFDQTGGTLGRGAQCDWCLSDDQYLSAVHAQITYQDGQFHITDVSSNGIFIDNTSALGKDNTLPIYEGMRIRLGLYELTASITLNDTTASVAIDDTLINGLKSVDDFDDQSTGLIIGSDFLPADSQPKVVDSNLIGNRVTVDSYLSPTTPAAVKAGAANVPKLDDDWDKTEYPFEKTSPPAAAQQPPLPPVPPPVVEPVVASAPIPAEPSAQPAPPPAGYAEVLQQLGLNPDQVDVQAIAQQWFALMPQMLTGLIKLLQQRGEIKQALNIERTSSHVQDNNPLKFAQNAAQAVHCLFGLSQAGFMAADRAIAEALSDLQAHQAALLDGHQADVQALQQRFNPDDIAQEGQRRRWQKGWLGRYLGPSNWEVYHYRYEHLVQSNHLHFSTAFAQAYNACLSRCKASQASADRRCSPLLVNE